MPVAVIAGLGTKSPYRRISQLVGIGGETNLMPLSPDIAARMARELVANYGRDAEDVAAERAQALAAVGNREAAQIWAHVSEIVLQLRTPCP